MAYRSQTTSTNRFPGDQLAPTGQGGRPAPPPPPAQTGTPSNTPLNTGGGALGAEGLPLPNTDSLSQSASDTLRQQTDAYNYYYELRQNSLNNLYRYERDSALLDNTRVGQRDVTGRLGLGGGQAGLGRARDELNERLVGGLGALNAANIGASRELDQERRERILGLVNAALQQQAANNANELRAQSAMNSGISREAYEQMQSNLQTLLQRDQLAGLVPGLFTNLGNAQRQNTGEIQRIQQFINDLIYHGLALPPGALDPNNPDGAQLSRDTSAPAWWQQYLTGSR